MPQDNDDSKKTKTQEKNPLSWIDDFDIPDFSEKLPSAPKQSGVDKPEDNKPKDDSQASLPKSSRDETRRRAANVRLGPNAGDPLRGYVPDPDDEEEPDLDPQRLDIGEPEPLINPENLPSILSYDLVPEDEIWPEWHAIENLPGYLSNVIRSVGRKTMGNYTRTPLEKIATIAYLLPPGEEFDPNDSTPRPNTPAEIKRVTEYLRDNATKLGTETAKHPPLPDYEAQVTQYSMNGIRFKMVVDTIRGQRVGMYIYAWPEKDSVRNVDDEQGRLENPSSSGTKRIREFKETNNFKNLDLSKKIEFIENSSSVSELDEILNYPTLPKVLISIINNRIKDLETKNLKESNMKKRSYSLNEFAAPAATLKLKLHQQIQEMRVDPVVLAEVHAALARELKQKKLNRSLSRLIGTEPSGKKLIRLLHKKHRLSDTAVYVDHDMNERMMWKLFKNHPDNFQIIIGTDGVAAIKPFEDDIKRGMLRKGDDYNPATDTTLRYQIVAFRGEKLVDPELLRMPVEPGDEPEERDVDPTVMRARGGIPSKRDVRASNIFDLLKEQIGQLTRIAITKGAVEREKISQRAHIKKGHGFDPRIDYVDDLAIKINPIVIKLLTNLNSEIYTDRRSMNLEPEDEVKLVQAQARIKDLLNKIKQDQVSGRSTALYQTVTSAIDRVTNTRFNPEKRNQWAYDLLHSQEGRTAKIGEFLEVIRQGLRS